MKRGGLFERLLGDMKKGCTLIIFAIIVIIEIIIL
jgi:hypothetical protein